MEQHSETSSPLLSPPPHFREPIAVYVAIFTVLAALLCGYVVGGVMHYGLIVVGISIILVGVVLGGAASSSSRRGNYTNLRVQGIIISVSAVVFFATAIIVAYSGLPDSFSFGSITDSMRAELEENQTKMLLVWVMMVLFPSLYGIEICKRKNAQFKVYRVPKDVRAFIQELHVNGADTVKIRSELRTMGWITDRDQDYALEAFYNQATVKSFTTA